MLPLPVENIIIFIITVAILSLDKEAFSFYFGGFTSLKALAEQTESPVLCGPRGKLGSTVGGEKTG